MVNQPLVQVYIGLGGNLDDPKAHIIQALLDLKQSPGIQYNKCSSLYLTRPMGPEGQPDYCNAACCISTGLSALALLDLLQTIEHKHHRVRRGERWGPRTLDLDLLLYGDEKINDPRLIVPHPGLHERVFVLYPLFEIAPNLVIPGKGALKNWLAQSPYQGIEKLPDDAYLL